MKTHIWMITALIVVSFQAKAQQTELVTDKDKLSYTFGFQIGSQIKRQFGSQLQGIDQEIFLQAIDEVLRGGEPRMTIDEMRAVVDEGEKQAEEKMNAVMAKEIAAGAEYQAKFSSEVGVNKTPSGILYRILNRGTGKKPGENDTVVVHYVGTHVNGEVFDSSLRRKNPATLPLMGVIRGWREVLQLMPVGSKWKVVIPHGQAYGSRGAPPNIKPGETLVFDIELLEIK